MMNSHSQITPVYIVLFTGLLLSSLAFYLLRNMEHDRDLASFSVVAEQHTEIVKDKMIITIDIIESIAALYAASERVTRSEFSIFVDVVVKDVKGIQAVEWIPKVNALDREKFETLARIDGLTGFQFTERNSQGEVITAGRREVYFPVYFVEPLEGNEAAVGYDLASNPARLAALNLARDSGRLQATSRITLIQETGKQFGILVFQPIYRDGNIPETVSERRQQLSGFALGVLRVGDIIGAELEQHEHDAVTVFVFDESAPLGQQLLYPSQSNYQSAAELTQEPCLSNSLVIGGRSWAIVLCRSEEISYYFDIHATSSLVLLVGLFVTLLLALYLRKLAYQRWEIQEAMSRLESSEARFSALAEASPVAIYIKNLEGQFLLASQAYRTWYGIEGEVKGKTVYDFFSEENADIYTSQDREIIETKKAHQWEIDMPSISGKTLSVLVVKFPIYGPEGEVNGIGGINLDLTERKKAASQVIQASKLATLGEMATSVAHELNQPLNVIRMAAGNILRKMRKGDVDSKYLSDKLERISAQTERASSIITHMRMFGRKADEKPYPIYPSDMVEGALAMMGEQLRLLEIEIRVRERPDPCPLVLGHQVQVEQVILNLLTNARDAIESNADLQERWIRLEVEIAGSESVKIIVEDSGGGIPEDIIERIFEPFYTTKKMGQGTGLGLSVSYGIIRDMGGSIIAINGDQGARFTITLPTIDAPVTTG